MTIAVAAKLYKELIKCGCNCCGRCECKKNRIHIYWTVSMQSGINKYQLKLFCPKGGFLLIWSIWFLYFSESTKNLQSIDIYMAIFGKPHFLPYGEPQGGYFAPRGFSVDFEHMVNLFSLKYIKFAILYKIKGLIIRNFDFSPTGEPTGELSLPPGAYVQLCFDCLP